MKIKDSLSSNLKLSNFVLGHAVASYSKLGFARASRGKKNINYSICSVQCNTFPSNGGCFACN